MDKSYALMKIYFALIALTGSNLDAVHAGINPDTTPIITETESPVIIFLRLREILKSIELVTT